MRLIFPTEYPDLLAEANQLRTKYVTGTAQCQEIFSQAAAFPPALLFSPVAFCSFVACGNTNFPWQIQKVMVYPMLGNGPQPSEGHLGLPACRSPSYFSPCPLDPFCTAQNYLPSWVHWALCGQETFLPDAQARIVDEQIKLSLCHKIRICVHPLTCGIVMAGNAQYLS